MPDLSPTSFALRSERLFDGIGFADDPVIYVEDGRVAAVGSDVPDTVEVHDLGPVTLLPGLVDCHQHLVFDGNGTLEDQVSGVSDQDLRARAWENARTALLGGVTTIRDLGDKNYVTLGLRGDAELPTILCAGPPITTVGGHCWYLGGESEPGPGLASAIGERIKRGCDVMKIMVTGGFLTPTSPMWKSQFGLADLQTVVRGAQSSGIPVAAHAHGQAGISDAIDARVATIEHCSFLNEEMEAKPDATLLERLAGSETAVSATFGQTPDALVPDAIRRILGDVFDALRRVHQLGGRIVLGSDAGINRSKPHDVARFAMKDFLAIGMSPIEALQALTIHGAEVLGLPNKGRLHRGADADLIAVEGDPGHDFEALTRVVQVWRGGNAVHDHGPS